MSGLLGLEALQSVRLALTCTRLSTYSYVATGQPHVTASRWLGCDMKVTRPTR